jgi:hypothetical protein
VNAETELALRQQQLLMRSAALRASLVDQSVVLEAPFELADRMHAAGRWVWRERFALIGGTAVAIVVLRPRRVWKLARFGWWAWRRARRMQAWLLAAGLVANADAATPRG